MGHRLLPFQPEIYHGTERSRPYFEGWYFKQSSNHGTFAVIPGIFRGNTEKNDIAFIQIIYNTSYSVFLEYSYQDFNFHPSKFEVWVENNFFSMKKMILDINRNEIRLEGEIFFGETTPLKTNIVSPSIMGPFSYLPGMQCNHGVLSLTHKLNGAININDDLLRFEDAVGYIEKDWGEAFPNSWIWMQCNDEKSSMMCSVASIPYGKVSFTGLICVVLTGSVQYRFATYNGGRVRSIIKHNNKITVVITKRSWRLEIHAVSKEFGRLIAPTKSGMNREIDESINATYRYTLYNNDKEIFSASSLNGGLEMHLTQQLLRNQED